LAAAFGGTAHRVSKSELGKRSIVTSGYSLRHLAASAFHATVGQGLDIHVHTPTVATSVVTINHVLTTMCWCPSINTWLMFTFDAEVVRRRPRLHIATSMERSPASIEVDRGVSPASAGASPGRWSRLSPPASS
jgi:hypothetical protein